MTNINEVGLGLPAEKIRKKKNGLDFDFHMGNRRILIVEDDATLKGILSRIVQKIDAKMIVDWVESAEDYLLSDSAHKLPPWPKYDLVLTDIYLPGGASGFDIWNHFTKRDPSTPVVMMSGMSQYDFFRSLGNSIAPPYLAKPLNFNECRALISGLMARKAGH